jgi:hypothetical protein
MTLTPDDRAEIHELYARYNHAVDLHGDAAGVADCFTHDGSYHHGRLGSYEGRLAIQEFMQRIIVEQGGGFQHWNDNLLLAGSADGATGSAYVVTIDCREEQPVLARASVYRDRLVRTGDGWRFQERRVGYPTPDPVP